MVVDPWVNIEEAKREYDIDLQAQIPEHINFTAVVGAVAHRQFCELTATNWQRMTVENGIFLDLKGIVPRELNPIRI